MMEAAFERARVRTRARSKIHFPQLSDEQLDGLMADSETRGPAAELKRSLIDGQAKMAKAHPGLSEREHGRLAIQDYVAKHPEDVSPVMAAIVAASEVSAAAGEAAATAARAAIDREEAKAAQQARDDTKHSPPPAAAAPAAETAAVGGKRKKAPSKRTTRSARAKRSRRRK